MWAGGLWGRPGGLWVQAGGFGQGLGVAVGREKGFGAQLRGSEGRGGLRAL